MADENDEAPQITTDRDPWLAADILQRLDREQPNNFSFELGSPSMTFIKDVADYRRKLWAYKAVRLHGARLDPADEPTGQELA